MERGIDIGKESGTLSGIENLMDTLKMTAEEAMAALKVPKEKWEIYMKRLEEGVHDREEIYQGGIFKIDQEDYERVRRKNGGAIEIEKGREQVLLIYKKIQAGEGDSKTIAESCGCTVEEVEMIRKELGI